MTSGDMLKERKGSSVCVASASSALSSGTSPIGLPIRPAHLLSVSSWRSRAACCYNVLFGTQQAMMFCTHTVSAAVFETGERRVK